MKKVSLSGSVRSGVGTKDAKQLRKEELVPCVMYGGKEQKHFVIPRLALNKFISTPEVFEMELDLEGTTYRTILKEVQFHPVTDRILHVDFYQIFDDKEVMMLIPVKFVGSSKGVLNGGVLRKNNRTLRVKALPDNLPDFIEADITNLKIGNKLYVTALENEAYKFMHPDNTVVCQVRTSRNAVNVDDEDEEEGETADAPEETAAE